VKVKDINKFKDIPTMLKEMGLKKILPRSKSYKDGEKVFEEAYGNRLKDAKFTAFTFEIVENKEQNGPQVKNKKNGEPNGPNVKKKKNGGPNKEQNEVENEEENNEEEQEEENSNEGPSVKRKKNGDNSSNGPHVKRKKNGESNEGPRVKNKKNGDSSNGPRVKNKKNGDRPPREFELTASEPWLSLIENGQKTVEGRLFKGIVEEFRVNDTIRFFNKMNGKEKSVKVKITKLTKYSNFGELLFNEKLYKVLPGLPNIKCGILVYSKLYKNSSFNEIKQFGTLAIELAVM
jgi:ASC-1-like (ASCH) protein